MHEAVDGGERHGLVGEYMIPLAECLICGDQDGSMFVSAADELEENLGFCLVFGNV